MSKRPLVLIHGYSDRGASFGRWIQELEARGYDIRLVRLANYQSLTNEITIKDLAEALDRALRTTAGLNQDEPFDAIVHSTGSLVIRSWLTTYEGRRNRLRNLIALAPANFGSPMAHKGRSWLGAMFKGSKELGPDFMEAGDRILSGLELGSRFTWDLAHTDLLGEEIYYGPSRRTPYVFVFCGTKDYGWLKRAVTEPGTDGTVRWAGCALAVRKIVLDLAQDPQRPDEEERVTIEPWRNEDMPLVLVDKVNHGTILSKPSPALVEMVDAALKVSTATSFEAWRAKYAMVPSKTDVPHWQQFVVRAVDERNDPIDDYYLRLYTRAKDGTEREIDRFAQDVHAFRDDPSLRCLHVNLKELAPEELPNLYLKVVASSGSALVRYSGLPSPSDTAVQGQGAPWCAEIDLSSMLRNTEVKFFYPFTTTLIQIRLNREPLSDLLSLSEYLSMGS
jgi:pimeloyl-ACP methyl ester carboxylesterase